MNASQLSLNQQLEDAYTKLGIKNLPSEVTEIISNSILEDEKGKVNGLLIGERAKDFTLYTYQNERFSLFKTLKEKPVVVTFLRGEWCPFCSLELAALQKIYPIIKAQGAELVAIHPQRKIVSENLTKKHKLSFPILNDPNQQTMKDYEVHFQVSKDVEQLYLDTFGMNLSKLNENGKWNLPVPAAFIIDTDFIIKGRHFSHSYTERISPNYIIEVLRNLPSTSFDFSS